MTVLGPSGQVFLEMLIVFAIGACTNRAPLVIAAGVVLIGMGLVLLGSAAR